MQLGRSPVSLVDLLREGLLHPGQELSFRRGSGTKGYVTAEGTIRFEGCEYASPSTAARAAAGGTSTNGWTAWYADTAAGLRSLAQLRSQLSTAAIEK
ncbi:MAG: hypothetical protein ACT4OX_14965 [Actinomycetota bacterium]